MGQRERRGWSPGGCSTLLGFPDSGPMASTPWLQTSCVLLPQVSGQYKYQALTTKSITHIILVWWVAGESMVSAKWSVSPGDNLPQMDPSMSKTLIMCLGINWTLKLEQWMRKQTKRADFYLWGLWWKFILKFLRHDSLGSRLRFVIEISPLLSLLEVRDKQYSILLNSSVLSIWIPRPPFPESRTDFSYPPTPQRLH